MDLSKEVITSELESIRTFAGSFLDNRVSGIPVLDLNNTSDGPSIIEVAIFSHTSNVRPKIASSYRVYVNDEPRWGGPAHFVDEKTGMTQSDSERFVGWELTPVVTNMLDELSDENNCSGCGEAIENCIDAEETI